MNFGTSGSVEFHFRALPYLDKKWLKADVGSALRCSEDLSNLWNHLVQDEEVVTCKLQTSVNASGDVAYVRPDGKYYCGVQSLNCSCCKGICSATSNCCCAACQLLETDEPGPTKKGSCSAALQQPGQQNSNDSVGCCSTTMLESWLWSPIPTMEEKRACTKKLIAEQREICLQAAANCLSSTRTKQLLYVYRRYFIALQRCKLDEKVSTDDGRFKLSQEVLVASDHEAAKLSKNSSFDRTPMKDCDKATFGLARVGTRAALNFSFAFLRRAWRSGEDVELCSELLSEALEALQTLPEASLFDTSQMSSLWIEVVEKSIKFLRQVVLGDVMGGRCLVPKADRHIALNLLLELGAQKGTLGGSLEGISLLLTLHEKDLESEDNRSPPQNSGAPLVPLLKRYEQIGSFATYNAGDSFHFGPTESFLRFLTLPENETTDVDLKQAAVIIISHLDRLAKPHLPAGNYSVKAINKCHQQKIFTLGWSSCSPEMYGFTSETASNGTSQLFGSAPRYSASTIDLPLALQAKQIVCTENSIYILTTNGQILLLHSNCTENITPKAVEGLEGVNVVQIAAHCEGRHVLALSSAGEIWSWGVGEGGRLGHGDTSSKEIPARIVALVEKQISAIFCGASYSAAITANGELYTWGRGTYGRLGHGNSDDKFIPMQVQALKSYTVVDVALGSGDAHSMCVTDGGLLFAWGDGDFGKLGNGSCNGSPVPVQVEGVANVARIFSGSQFSVALSYDGKLYSWGKGHGGRLGHGNSEHSNVPLLIHTLEGRKVVDVAVGSAHCLALTNSGELYGWGRNDYQQICPSCVSRDPIIQSPILTTPPTLRISGMACGAAQSIVWCHSSTLGVAAKIPFVVDLSDHTFRMLDQLLCMVCNTQTGPGDIRHPPSQEAECVAVASLNLLRLQLHAMIVNNVSARQVGLVEGSRLLASLKSRILGLAGGPVILKTIQEAAQWTLQVGWSILLPTASERAQTLTSLLPAGHDTTTASNSSGHRFMTDLLVGSLMAEGGLQTALNQAINAQRSQDCTSTGTHLSLLHLLKQLLRNNSSLTQARLGQLMLGPYLKTEEAFSSPEPPSPSLDLLHKFQRLLLSYMHQSKTDDLSGAEALLDTYIQQVVTACVTTLNKAHETILQGKDGVPDILKNDISDALLHELLIGLVLIQREKSFFLSSFDWNKHFIPLLHALDNFNRLTHEGEVFDSDDMGWPGIICRGATKAGLPVQEETLLIRQSDIENHCNDGGHWVIINGNVYDVKDYQAESPATQEILTANAGKDISLEISNPQHRTALEFITSFLRVGRYAINEICDKESPRQMTTLTHFHSECMLSYLLGLRCSVLQAGSTLQPAETQCKNLLNSIILSGGLQVLQPSNPFDEEKGEARSSGSTAGSTPTDASSQIPIADVPQMANWPSVLISHRVENMLSNLGEGKLTDPLVASWIAICERYCKEHHLIWHQEFPPEHPVMELERLLMAVLIRHQNLGPLALAVVDRELSGNCSKPPQPIVNIIKIVHQTKWAIVKMRQQLNRSYKEVCAPMIDKCRFLLYEIRPAISLEQHGLANLHILHKLPRFKALVYRIIADIRAAKKQLATAKPEDILNVTIQSQFSSSITKIQSQENLSCKNLSTENLVHESLIKVESLESLTAVAARDRSSSPVVLAVQKHAASDENLLSVGSIENAAANNCTTGGGVIIGGGGDGGGDKKISLTSDEIKTPTNELIDYNSSKMKNPDGGDEFINNVIASLSEKCLLESYPSEFKNGVSQQIVDFILYDLCDVETLRRAMYCQIQRYQIRKQGLEMFYELLKIVGLFDAAQYNLFNGYLGLHAAKECDQNEKYILENLNMITAFQKADILIAQAKIIEWSVAELQKYVNQEKINGRHRNHGEKDNSNLGTYVFLKKLPRARFLLSIFGILSKTYEANELSLLINSGVLGSIMGLLRQTGADLPNTRNNTDISVIYEDVVKNLKSAKEALPGPELAKLMKIGTRIARGADWKWAEQDGPGGEGRIISEIGEDGWVRVEWDNGSTNSYRMGKEGQYDLRLADSALKALSPDKDSEPDELADPQMYSESHPTKLLRNVCIKTLHMMFTSAGMHADRMQENSLRSVASMFRAILTNRVTNYNFGLEQWTTLGFLRAISSSKALSKQLTSPVWIDLAFEVLNAAITCKKDVYKKLHCLRLLQSTLVNWGQTEAGRVDDIIVKLFEVLGRISLYCPNDLSLLNNSVDVKSRVLYSASHTGTIGEEIIVLIRKLHTLPLWNENINSFIAQKLCLVADVFLVNELEINFEGEKSAIMGTLCTIGGCDSRPRLGLNLTLDGVRGTISRMTKKGKVVMNVHSLADSKKIPIFKVSECADIGAFSLSKLTINEMLLNSWAVLFYGIGQTPMNVTNSINTQLLLTQQINFSALKATKVLFRHQSLLRKILRQRSPGITRSSSKDSLSDRDASPEDGKSRSESNTSDESNTYTELLIQTMLIRATQPSPLKACYSFQEMELAALNITQMLASYVHNDMNAPAGSNKRALPLSMPTMIHGVPLYNHESGLEDAQTPSGAEVAATLSVASGGGPPGIGCNRGTARRSPPGPLVAQIMEMGFTRKSVETAIKSLTLHTNIRPTAEQVVQWILEHPDVTANLGGKGDDNDAHSDTESVSSDTMEGSSSLHDSQHVIYKLRDDFKTADQYAMYVRGFICTGMLVRCCQDFEEVRKGEIGTVLKVEPEGLHDLNVRVDFQLHDRPYWMRFGHLEMLEAPCSENSSTISVGSQVRIRQSQHFRYRLNTVPRGSVGTVNTINGNEVTVEFPNQIGWNGHLSELELVSNALHLQGLGQAGALEIIDDWSRCIRSLTVSSNEASAKNLLDRSSNYWQSSSTQGKHWIRLEMHYQVLIQSLSINVDPDDYSHMPSLVIIRAGDCLATLKEIHWVSVNPTDVVVPLLNDCRQYYAWIEIFIKQCRNNGIQCKVHGIQIVGKRRPNDLEMMMQNASFLASDNDVGAEPTFTANFSDEQAANEITSKVLVWGLNDKEQLGGLKGSKVKLPTYSSVLSQLKPIHIAGGSKSLFIVSQDGKLYACGEGTNGRLGLGHNNNVPTPRPVPILNQYVVKKVAVHSGGKHAMALTLDGKVFSWGEGEDGKLGHGNRLTLEKPKLIESLRTKRIRDIACGSSHSAAITSSGELYTWGLGEYGRLGHGDNCTQLKPKLVTALQGHRVTQVACGSRDAQTLCLTEEGLVFSWGDGDFGKLGRGGSEGCSVPHQVDRLNGVGVIQIECGAQFSLALTKVGEVWTWGKGDYYRLGHGTDQHVRKPTPIQGLRGKKVIHVAVGALHCLAVTDNGQVFAWGDNDHGQQGSSNTVVNKKPNLVLGLDGVFVNRVACGSSHSVAWSMPQNPSDQDKEHPLAFAVHKDPLGSHSLGIHASDTEPTTLQPPLLPILRPQRPSLSERVLSLETYGARQAALSHILNAMSILHARSCIIAALTGHSQLNLQQDKATEGYTETRPITPISDNELHDVKADAEIVKQQQQQNEVIAHGGGEAPADVSGLTSNDINDYDIPIVSGMNNTLSAYRSLTGSLSLSASISSCNATQRQSKMSASAMSVMAATMTHHDEIMNEATIANGLDDFTVLLGETEAKHLIELLKLSVSGRTGPAKTSETIANTLIALARSNTNVSNMLIETCITELEDLCTSRHSLGKLPKPVMQESNHPYIDDVTITGHVKIPGADYLRLEFDSQCSTERRNDPLVIYDCFGRAVSSRSGREWAQWAPDLRLPGDEMRWRFQSDSSVNGWGWRFYVHAIMPESYLKELGSDRTKLSQPSMSMVMALLDSSLVPHGGNTLVRLAAALSQCAQLSALTVEQRIWSLKKMHQYLTIKDAPRALEPAMVEILSPLIPIVLRQYEYEEPQVRSGLHLMHSEYFKTLVALACDMQLDSLLPHGEAHKWAWFRRYCSAVRVAQSLIRRVTLPPTFTLEVRKKLIEIASPAANPTLQNTSTNSLTSSNCSLIQHTSSTSNLSQQGFDSSGSLHGSEIESIDTSKYLHEDHTYFTPQYDSQLLQWFNRRPEDWAFSWGGASTIFGWGHNHRGQLGGLDGSRIKIPTPCEALSLLRPIQIAGGEQTLYAVTPDGKLYATGYGAGGRLGIGGTDSVSTPTLVESLQHVIIKKVAVNSGGKHCLALSSDGEVFSWGEGEDGKLGHGNRDSYDRPKLIEALSGIGVIDIACGSAHSACITSQGHVLTWGKGRYGRLGHGDSEDQLQPKLVEALLGYRAIDIACGSGDAQTLCITDDDNVWSWGDGDYGKLGRGGSDGCKIPMKIESLAGLGVVKVECGSQFSVALTRSGSIYTWGKGDYHRLGHGNTDHVRRPKKVAALQGKKIISIATGSLHCVACSDSGEVFTWGDNDEGQLGDGTVTAIQRPRLVQSLQGKHIVKVICGSAHTLALSTYQLSEAVRPPPSPPLEYDLVRDIAPEVLHARLVLLHHFSELICPCLAMLPISGELSLGSLKDILVYSIKEAGFRKVIQTTMVRDKPHGPVIELNRIQVKRSRMRSGNGLAGVDGMKSVFGQMVQKLPLLTQEALSMPHRVWKVKFVGESVDDCGGGFSESIAEMCDELQNGSVPLLIQTPNGRGEAGANRDCFLLDPTLNSVLHMNMLRFLGVLMGIAVRTGSPLSLNLAEPVWRQLCGETLRPSDLTEVDRDYITGLLYIRDIEDDPKAFASMELPFSTPSAKGHEVPLSTRFTKITPDNRKEYVKLALHYRIHEFDEQVKAVRDGMSKVIPVPLLSLFSAVELQAMVCGSPDIPLCLLKTVATYKGVESTASLVQWFWEVMEEFTNQERSLFLRFVWGRTRLPRTIADFRGRDFVLQVLDKYNPPDHFLPESYTCFFLLKMPRYSCKAVLQEKLKYAIYFCKSIDTDEYARVAMGDPTEATGSEDNSDIESIA
ncbi:probable E3 ubiquitin-protein ligase HERC2 isoform X2 [Sabethes cyaneus]|uniref:probable E3 ubiquitin-protein ligase HERC2 isoform X2 n=1 Tax=Sabethes cyaneus TaxID=53552 RepID=UPI00237E95A4|nr:probable E3 ubiquitin-protein ligase HERC2 isoform X2 [Sabethes cyaneus]